MIRLRALVIGFALIPAAAVAAEQPPPRDARPNVEKGSAIIRGRIVAADTGKPLRRARVTITAPELAGEPRNTSTDAEGRYEFTDLPAGRFTLRVRRSGYLPLAYGQRRPREAAKPLQVLDKEAVERSTWRCRARRSSPVVCSTKPAIPSKAPTFTRFD